MHNAPPYEAASFSEKSYFRVLPRVIDDADVPPIYIAPPLPVDVDVVSDFEALFPVKYTVPSGSCEPSYTHNAPPFPSVAVFPVNVTVGENVMLLYCSA